MILAALAPALALDADTFSPAGSAFDGLGGLQLDAPDLAWPGSGYGALALVYAHDSVVYSDGEPLVPSRFGMHLLGGYTVAGALRIEAEAPIYALVTWEDQAGAALGDVSLHALVPVVRRERTGFALAVRPGLGLPTGNAAWLVGAGGVGASLSAEAAYAPMQSLDFGASVGVLATRATRLGDQELGSGLEFGLGAGYRLSEALRLGAELDGTVDFSGTDRASPVELHGYGTYDHPEGATATLALGTGLAAGVGAPAVRVVLAGGWRFAGEEPFHDRDEDLIADADDACVDAAEDKDGFEDGDGCPDDDNDADRLPDGRDTCPDRAEDPDGFDDADGCPDDDNDGDTLPDADDACPIAAGPRDTGGCPDGDADGIADSADACPADPGVAAMKGCPDRDADGIADDRDACPDVAKDPAEDPARSDGCPKRVFVTLEKIEIRDVILFDTGTATIQAQSDSLLQEIANLVNKHPDLGRIEVGGHTDNVGSDAKNLALSEGRARAVVAWLVERGGVPADRLVARGYGETRPIDTNSTASGRAANRRVEFAYQR